MYVYVYAYVHANKKCTRTHTHTGTDIHTHTNTHTYTRRHTHTHTYIHTHTHTHTHTHSSSRTITHAQTSADTHTGHAVLATARGHHSSWSCACSWLQAPAYLSWVKRRGNKALNSPIAAPPGPVSPAWRPARCSSMDMSCSIQKHGSCQNPLDRERRPQVKEPWRMALHK